MPRSRARGATALEGLVSHYNDVDVRCPACGHVDGGGWRARTSGDRVTYTRVCPSCGEVRTRTLRLE